LSINLSDIDSDLAKITGDKQVADMLREQMLNDRKEKVVKAYIEGIKKHIKIKVNKQLIA